MPVVTARVNGRVYSTTTAIRNDGAAAVSCEAIYAAPDASNGKTLRARYEIAAGETLVDARRSSSRRQSAENSVGEILATLPLTSDRKTELSVFIAFDFDGMANAIRRILTNADGLLEVLACMKHDLARTISPAASELSAHPLLIHGTAPDWFMTGGKKAIESGHKIGGRSYIEQAGSSLLAKLET